jgi:ferredoxin-thioredoxin reductase catalytic subunit
MKIKLNPDQEIVNTIREGLKRTGGYCPCRVERTEATKCMCQEFKDQIADPLFECFCHCMLFATMSSDELKKDKYHQRKISFTVLVFLYYIIVIKVPT